MRRAIPDCCSDLIHLVVSSLARSGLSVGRPIVGRHRADRPALRCAAAVGAAWLTRRPNEAWRFVGAEADAARSSKHAASIKPARTKPSAPSATMQTPKSLRKVPANRVPNRIVAVLHYFPIIPMCNVVPQPWSVVSVGDRLPRVCEWVRGSTLLLIRPRSVRGRELNRRQPETDLVAMHEQLK